jgi:hypothetical protein
LDPENITSEECGSKNCAPTSSLQTPQSEAVKQSVDPHNAAENAWQKGDFRTARKGFNKLVSPDHEDTIRTVAHERLKRMRPDGLAVAVSVSIALALFALWVLSIRAFP